MYAKKTYYFSLKFLNNIKIYFPKTTRIIILICYTIYKEREDKNMGVDTKGYIKGYVSADEIVNFIRQKYDKNAENHVTCKKYGALTN